jgi:hypothetical protein
MVIFRFFFYSKFWGLVWPRKLFSWKKSIKKINFRLFWIQQIQISLGCHVHFQRNTESSLWNKSVFSTYFPTFFQKLGFQIFQLCQWNYIETYDYLYLLGSKKSKVYFFLSCFVQENFHTVRTRPQNFG